MLARLFFIAYKRPVSRLEITNEEGKENETNVNLLGRKESWRKGSPGEDVEAGDHFLVERSTNGVPEPYSVIRFLLEPGHY